MLSKVFQNLVLLSYETKFFIPKKDFCDAKQHLGLAVCRRLPAKTFGHPFRSEFAMLQVCIRSQPDLFLPSPSDTTKMWGIETFRNIVTVVNGGLVGTKPHLAIAPSHSACLLGGRADGEQNKGACTYDVC